MLCDLARMPQIEVRLEALTYVISARWQLREEHSKLQRLAVALEHLNGAAGRQELSLLFGTALTVGHALLSGRQGNAADAGADAAADAAADAGGRMQGFTLGSLPKLKNVTCRYHPTFTLLHHVTKLWADNEGEGDVHAEASGGSGGGSGGGGGGGSGGGLSNAVEAALPETTMVPERAPAMTAASLIVVDDDYASFRAHDNHGRSLQGVSSQRCPCAVQPTEALRERLARVPTASDADREGVSKLDQLLSLLLYDLEHQDQTRAFVQEQYCLFREFIQGDRAPRMSTQGHREGMCGSVATMSQQQTMIDGRASLDEFRQLVACARDAWCDPSNATALFGQAKAAMLRVEAEAEAETEAKTTRASKVEPPRTKIAHGSGRGARDRMAAEAEAEAEEPETIADTDAQGVAVQVGPTVWPPPPPQSPPRRESAPASPPAAEFVDVRSSLADKFKAIVTTNQAPTASPGQAAEGGTLAPAAAPAETKKCKAWHFEPLDASAAPLPPVFVVAADRSLSPAQTSELRRLFSRGAFVGLDKVRGKEKKADWFTMDRFLTGTTDEEGNRARKVLQEGGAKQDSAASKAATAILQGHLEATTSATVKSVPLASLIEWKKQATLKENGVEMASKLELYLNDADFAEAMGMDKAAFGLLPNWKKANCKKNAGLF